MDELETLANSRAHAQKSDRALEHRAAPAGAGLTWPRLILGTVLVPPMAFCAIFFSSLNEGHPPASVLAIMYVYLVTPFASPFGLLFSFRAYLVHPSREALLLLCIFIVGTVASWIWFMPFVLRGWKF